MGKKSIFADDIGKKGHEVGVYQDKTGEYKVVLDDYKAYLLRFISGFWAVERIIDGNRLANLIVEQDL